MRRYLAMLAAVFLAALAGILGPLAFSADPAPQAQPSPRTPGTVWRNGTMELRLTDDPCPFEEERDQLELEGIPPAKRYVVTQGTRKHSGCWVRDMGGDLMTLEPGAREVGTIPKEWLAR